VLLKVVPFSFIKWETQKKKIPETIGNKIRRIMRYIKPISIKNCLIDMAYWKEKKSDKLDGWFIWRRISQ
jgi:hypothetical protein